MESVAHGIRPDKDTEAHSLWASKRTDSDPLPITGVLFSAKKTQLSSDGCLTGGKALKLGLWTIRLSLAFVDPTQLQ